MHLIVCWINQEQSLITQACTQTSPDATAFLWYVEWWSTAFLFWVTVSWDLRCHNYYIALLNRNMVCTLWRVFYTLSWVKAELPTCILLKRNCLTICYFRFRWVNTIHYYVEENHMTIFSSFSANFPPHYHTILAVSMHASNWFTHLQRTWQTDDQNDSSVLTVCIH